MPQLASVTPTNAQSLRELQLQFLSILERLPDPPCEPNFVETDIRNWLQPRLCEACKKIDFEALAADTNSSRASRRPKTLTRDDLGDWKPDASLGSLEDVILRADHCNLCKLIAKVSRKTKLFEQYPDLSIAYCGINLEAYAEFVLSNETIQVNRFNIVVIDPLLPPLPNIILSLQACSSPIPFVTDVGKSVRGLQLDMQLEGTPASLNLPTGRSISQFVNRDLFQEWISICLEDHKDACGNPEWIIEGETQHPSLLLIDIQGGCIVDAPEDCNYFALSYVWGPRPPAGLLRLLISNEDELRQTGAIDWSDERIPKTIIDAASLVNGLGYQYLWVDSLCIIQDDENDKASQIQYMDSIYALALVTIIAADRSHANHGLAGWTDNPRKVQQSSVKVSKNMYLMEHVHLHTGAAYDTCTWKTRGWTMQELLCSRRTIMLTADQAFWTCARADWCETIALEPFSKDKLRIVKKTAIGNSSLFDQPPRQIKPFASTGVA